RRPDEVDRLGERIRRREPWRWIPFSRSLETIFMSPLTNEAPLALDRPDLVHGVREVLDRVGFDQTHIPEQCGVKEMDQLSLGILDRPRLLWRTRDGGPLSTLIRLFSVGVPVEIAALRRAVEPMDPADWAALGLIKLEGTKARRAFAVRPWGPLMLAYDFAHPAEGQRHDHVMGVSGTTLYLAIATIRPQSRRTLDLGTGSGYQALLAAAHSQHVLATDRNPRAVTITRFNALLSRITNVEAAVSDLFASIDGPPFDLIVTNPPFVVSPDNSLQFRDSGLQGDEISERLVRGAPAYLAEGGFAQFLCAWVRVAGQDWKERIVSWINRSGCDAWITHTSSPIDEYADHWLRQGDVSDPARVAAAFDRWMAYYQQLGIEAIDTALIVLRRRSGGANWIRFDGDRLQNHPNGVAIQAVFAAQDLLERHGSDRALLDLRLRCRRELRMVQKLEPSDSGWLVENAQCILGNGLEFEGRLDQALFHVLTLCRGQQPLSAVLAQAAARTGQSIDQISTGCLATVRSLIDQGFLWPVDEEPVVR
ncbi:MAG: methyltransferase, partial [Isosphaeraceae bacterium]